MKMHKIIVRLAAYESRTPLSIVSSIFSSMYHFHSTECISYCVHACILHMQYTSIYS